MPASILCIGNELTSGTILDTNSGWLARRLAEVGIVVETVLILPDQSALISRELRRLSAEHEFIFVCGGLGPTEDDLTRQALADAMGRDLVFDAMAFEQIKKIFEDGKRKMHESNRLQALHPEGSELIPNFSGTAPGIRARLGNAELFVFPGVPREMNAMYERSVKPWLVSRSNGRITLSATLLCFGASEAEMGASIRDLMERGKNPVVGTNAHESTISIRIHSTGSSRAEAEARLAECKAEVRGRLGRLVFGEEEETLAGVVMRELVAREQSVSCVEGFTSGLVSSQLSGLVEGQERFLGALLSKDLPLFTEEQVSGAALKALAHFRSDYVLAVSSKVQEPSASLFRIGVLSPAGFEVSEARYGNHLAVGEMRRWVSKAAINKLRLKLLGG